MILESPSKKKRKLAHGGPGVQQETPSSKKMGTEIDDIFAGKKRKRPEKEMMANKEKLAKGSASSAKSLDKSKIGKKNKVKDLQENPFADPISRPRRKTADGLAIYTEEELRFGKSEAGGTRLCPFDCDCCF